MQPLTSSLRGDEGAFTEDQSAATSSTISVVCSAFGRERKEAKRPTTCQQSKLA